MPQHACNSIRAASYSTVCFLYQLYRAAQNIPYMAVNAECVMDPACLAVIFIVHSLRLIYYNAKSYFLVFHLQDLMRAVHTACMEEPSLEYLAFVLRTSTDSSASTLMDLAPVRPTACHDPPTFMNSVKYNKKALALLSSCVLVGKKHNWGDLQWVAPFYVCTSLICSY